MIRRFVYDDIDAVMLIWLEANLSAHNFINANYWHSKYNAVRNMISEADVYVYEENRRISAFIGIADGYIDGLFVAADMRSRGVGKLLLDKCKGIYDTLTLRVYERNRRAVKFYSREGFYIEDIKIDAETGEKEYLMKRKAKIAVMGGMISVEK